MFNEIADAHHQQEILNDSLKHKYFLFGIRTADEESIWKLDAFSTEISSHLHGDSANPSKPVQTADRRIQMKMRKNARSKMRMRE